MPTISRIRASCSGVTNLVAHNPDEQGDGCQDEDGHFKGVHGSNEVCKHGVSLGLRQSSSGGLDLGRQLGSVTCRQCRKLRRLILDLGS
jgi:hypothetical protein